MVLLLVAADERERRAVLLLLDLLAKDAARRVANANIFIVDIVLKINSINWKDSFSVLAAGSLSLFSSSSSFLSVVISGRQASWSKLFLPSGCVVFFLFFDDDSDFLDIFGYNSSGREPDAPFYFNIFDQANDCVEIEY